MLLIQSATRRGDYREVGIISEAGRTSQKRFAGARRNGFNGRPTAFNRHPYGERERERETWRERRAIHNGHAIQGNLLIR